MKLTPIQVEIIEHRLEVPDAIYDACESAIDAIGPPMTVGEFNTAVANVSEMIKGDFARTDYTNVEWLILEDAIEGSTLPDTADDATGYPIDAGGISQQKANAYRTAHEQLLTWIGGE